MKMSIPLLVAIALAIFGVPLFAGGTQDVKEATGPAGEPQYGGTLTALNFLTDALGVPDPAYGSGTTQIKNIVGERILVGDVHKYGARGTGEFSFRDDAGLPLKFTKGGLIDRWEVTDKRLTLHVRQGVMWSGQSINKVMDKREVTAEDIVFNYRRLFDQASGAGGYIRGIDWIKKPEVDSVYALDKYTVVFETNFFYSNWDGTLTGGGGQLFAPESFKASAPDKLKWETMVGTGPFWVKEYVPGSHIKFGSNPDYWQKTTIGGKEYRTPFVDELIVPMIKDEATAVAALQTATVDMHMKVNPPYVPAITKSRPELKSARSGAGLANAITFNVTKPPFNDRNVRRAMMIGTDRKGVSAMVMEPWLDYIMLPFARGWEGWVDLKDMPESTRQLYTYNPELAKKMLADAGYPQGFQIDLLSMNTMMADDVAEMIADQWQKLGVTVKITVKDETAVNREVRPPAQMNQHALSWRVVTHTPILFAHTYFGSTGPRNASHYKSDYVDTRLLTAMKEQDDAKRVQMMREANLRIQDDAPSIGLALPSWQVFWWPWVNNCYGEVWYQIHTPDYHNYWIDGALKKKMGH